MDLQNETKEEVYRYDFECTPEEEKALIKIAIRRFAKDKQAQLDYAVNTILSEFVDNMNLDTLTEKKEKKEKHGNKNNNRK